MTKNFRGDLLWLAGELRRHPAHLLETRIAMAWCLYNRYRKNRRLLHRGARFHPVTSAQDMLDPSFAACLAVALGVISGQLPDPTGGADHFHSPADHYVINPKDRSRAIAGYRFFRHTTQNVSQPAAAA